MVASRWPQRFLPAASISFSTSVGQIFARANLGIRPPSCRDCSIYGGWFNDLQAWFHQRFSLWLGVTFRTIVLLRTVVEGPGPGLTPALPWTWTGRPTRRIRIGPRPARRRMRSWLAFGARSDRIAGSPIGYRIKIADCGYCNRTHGFVSCPPGCCSWTRPIGQGVEYEREHDGDHVIAERMLSGCGRGHCAHAPPVPPSAPRMARPPGMRVYPPTGVRKCQKGIIVLPPAAISPRLPWEL